MPLVSTVERNGTRGLEEWLELYHQLISDWRIYSENYDSPSIDYVY
jgi:hypothetical protein